MDIIALSARRALEYRTTQPVYAIRIFDHYDSDANPKDQILTLPEHSIVTSYQFEEYEMDFYNRPETREKCGHKEIDEMQKLAFTKAIAQDIITHFTKN